MNTTLERIKQLRHEYVVQNNIYSGESVGINLRFGVQYLF